MWSGRGYGLEEPMKTQGSDSWQVLTGSQIERIRGAAWGHLERHGFVVQHDGLLALAKARGAQVDEVSGRVRLSRSLSAELMALVPPRYTIGNILGETWEIGGEEQYGTAIVTDPWIIDYQTLRAASPVPGGCSTAHHHRRATGASGQHQPHGLPGHGCARANLQSARAGDPFAASHAALPGDGSQPGKFRGSGSALPMSWPEGAT